MNGRHLGLGGSSCFFFLLLSGSSAAGFFTSSFRVCGCDMGRRDLSGRSPAGNNGDDSVRIWKGKGLGSGGVLRGKGRRRHLFKVTLVLGFTSLGRKVMT